MSNSLHTSVLKDLSDLNCFAEICRQALLCEIPVEAVKFEVMLTQILELNAKVEDALLAPGITIIKKHCSTPNFKALDDRPH